MPIFLYLLALAVFAQGTSEFVFAGILRGISDDLGVPLSQAGSLTSAFAVGMIIGAPTMAAVGRKLSPCWTLSGFLAVFILLHVVGAVTDDFGVLLATRVAAAFANAGFLAVTLSTVVQIIPAERRARALSVILGGTTLALIAGVPAGAFVGSALGWRATLWAIAVVSLPALLAVLLVMPTRAFYDTETNADKTLAHELMTLRFRPVQMNIVMAVLVNAATFGSFTYLAVVASGAAAVSETAIPVLLAVFGLGAFCGVTLAGKFGDRHWRHLITTTSPLLLLGWISLTAMASNPVAVWVLALVQGALSFALGSTLIARVVATAHGAPTMGGSFATVALNLGAVIGPVAGGIAIEAIGVRGPVVASAVFVLAAVIVWATAQASSRRELTSPPMT